MFKIWLDYDGLISFSMSKRWVELCQKMEEQHSTNTMDPEILFEGVTLE